MAFQEEYCDSRDYDVWWDRYDAAMDLGQLKQLMDEWGESQAGLARLLGISPDKFNKVVKGKRRLTVEEADTLRRYFGIKEEESGVKPRRLPIVGLVSAGLWREGFENIMGWMPSPDPALSKDAFAVVVEGSSMNEVAKPGDAVIVDPGDRQLINGKFYIVRNFEGETTFKQYRENPARLEPCSDDPTHHTIYPGQDGFEVVGRVRKIVHDV
jgi:repressor LexA